MPISEPRPRPDAAPNYKSTPSPDAAGLISFLLPGLGQIWGGEKRKGALFLAAHVINVTVLVGIVFSPWILKSLDAFGQANEMKLNQQLSQSFTDLGFGSPTSVIVGLLLLSFSLFAARDAFDQSAQRKRQAIYHDYVLAMPEATSGSYIFHVSLLLACLVLAFFFLIPPAPRSQVTDIEFLQNEENTKEKPVTNKHAEHNSKAAGKHDPTRPTDRASAHQASASSKSSESQSKSQDKVEAPKPAVASKPAEAPKPVEVPKTSEASKPKADPPTSNIVPGPQPQLPAPSLTLPKPATPTPIASAPKPSFPAITPTISAPPTTIRNPLMPLPAAGRPSNSAPTPVALKEIAMGVPGPAVPRSPAQSTATAPSGGLAPIAVASIQGASTGGGAPQPVPVAVRSGSNTGRGAKGASDNVPAPTRGSKTATGFGQPGGPSSLTSGPVLIHGGPGTGASNNLDSGPREGNSLTAAADIDWSAYMADLQRHIKRCWYPPTGGETKRVKVIFSVTTTGELSNLRLLRSCGLAIADRAALKAVEDAAPFRHLPDHAPASVDIEFTFDYNVYGGGALR